MSPDGFMVRCDHCKEVYWTTDLKRINLCDTCRIPADDDLPEPLPFDYPLHDDLSIETWRVIGAVMADRETRRMKGTKA